MYNHMLGLHIKHSEVQWGPHKSDFSSMGSGLKVVEEDQVEWEDSDPLFAGFGNMHPRLPYLHQVVLLLGEFGVHRPATAFLGFSLECLHSQKPEGRREFADE